MKLLFILPEYLPHAGGGIITYYRMLLPRFAALGHEVKVIIGSGVFAALSAPAISIDGVTVETLDLALLKRYLPRFAHYAATPGLQRYLAAAWALREQAKGGEGFDVVEATDWGLLFLPWVVEPGPPVLVQAHGSCGQIDIHDPVAGEELQGQLIRLLEQRAITCADAVQSYSPANAEFWRNQSGCAVEFINPAWRPPEIGPVPVPRSGPGLVVGRVQRWKGPQVLCAALRLLGDRAPQMEWMGRDTTFESRGRTTSRQLAEEFPDVWNKRLCHRPQQPPEKTSKLQAQASFIVVPSTWDMFNFTCVEAMGVSTPVICSTGAGACHLIQDGVNGLVFENENAASLANTLDRYLSMSPSSQALLGQAGRQTILEALDPDRITELRYRSYTEVAHRTRNPRPPSDWLYRACAPGAPLSDPLSFLEHLPLKPLARHVGHRAVAKFRR